MNREADGTNGAPQAGMLTKCNNSAQSRRPGLEYMREVLVFSAQTESKCS